MTAAAMEVIIKIYKLCNLLDTICNMSRVRHYPLENSFEYLKYFYRAVSSHLPTGLSCLKKL